VLAPFLSIPWPCLPSTFVQLPHMAMVLDMISLARSRSQQTAMMFGAGIIAMVVLFMRWFEGH
jgi:hypothetical protein